MSVIGNAGTGAANVADITGTSNQFLGVNAAGTSLAFSAVPNTALQNSSVTISAGTGLSGGGTVSLGGSETISVTTNGITNSLLRQSSGLSVIGNASTGAANVADITGTSNQFLGVNAAGTALSFSAVPNTALQNSSVTITAGTGLS